jgi:D-alanyl-D-alanine carboxypeptidase
VSYNSIEIFVHISICCVATVGLIGIQRECDTGSNMSITNASLIAMRRLLVVLITLMPLFSRVSAQSITIPTQIATLWAQSMAQPENFAVACMPLNHQSQTVLYNGSRFPLASVSKLIIFIEYATRVDTGLIPLDEMVSLSTLELYNLPRTDRGAHDRFLAAYTPGTMMITLWDLAVDGMMQYSSNAASDYLLHRLSPVDWDALFLKLGIYDSSAPNSLTMIPLLMNNHLDGRATLDTVSTLSASLGESYLDHYVNDGAWRQAEIAYRSDPQGNNGRSWRNWPDWNVQSAILQAHTATGNVNDYRNIMNAIYGSVSPLSPNVQYIVRTALKWNNNDFIDANYIEYGSKLGFYSGGTLTMVAYGQPINGEPVISVIFLRDLPQDAYRELLREDSIGDFAHWLNMNACGGLNALISATLN